MWRLHLRPGSDYEIVTFKHRVKYWAWCHTWTHTLNTAGCKRFVCFFLSVQRLFVLHSSDVYKFNLWYPVRNVPAADLSTCELYGKQNSWSAIWSDSIQQSEAALSSSRRSLTRLPWLPLARSPPSLLSNISSFHHHTQLTRVSNSCNMKTFPAGTSDEPLVAVNLAELLHHSGRLRGLLGDLTK